LAELVSFFIALAVVIFIFGVILEFVTNNAGLLLGLAAVLGAGYLIYSNLKASKEAADLRRQRAESERAAEERRKLEEKERKNADRKFLYDLHDGARQVLENCPKLLGEAEKHLSDALVLFEQRAFYLFWDKLELAATAIHKYKNEVERLNHLSEIYMKRGERLSEPIPKFPGVSSSNRLSTEPALTLERIDQLFHSAHRDFEFASIYSTRKTNTILTKGFASLSEAMRQISSDIHDVGRQLETGFRSLEASMDRMESSWSKGVRDIVGAVDSNNEKIAQMNRESLETERKMLDTLDNIQHGRVPLPTISSELKHATSTMPKKD
jgi:hypothetical protein